MRLDALLGTAVLLGVGALVALDAVRPRGTDRTRAEFLARVASPAAPRPLVHGLDTAAGESPAVAPGVQRVLDDIRAADRGQLAVSEEDGRFLRVLVAAMGAARVLEIGAASGYSAIWIGLGVRESGGRLVTIEYDADRAREAAENVRRAGLEDVVQVIAGDAFVEIPRLDGAFDVVFLDAWKADYGRFFELVFPRVRPGGVVLAHNVINKQDEMADFLQAIQTHPDALTTIVSPGPEGISLTYKKR